MHLAAHEGHHATVQWIVEHDSDLVALRTDKHGLKPGYNDATPLRTAELQGHAAVARYLKASPYYVRAAQKAAEAAEAEAKKLVEDTERAEAMAALLILEEEAEEKEKAAKKKGGAGKAKAKKKGAGKKK